MSIEIFLIRHGKSKWNSDNVFDRFNGHQDVELSEQGHEQAKKLANYFKNIELSAIYCSPLIRSVSTANYVEKEKNLVISVENELIEIDFGEWEGLTIDEISSVYPKLYKKWVEDPATIKAPNGESGYQVASRVIQCLNKLIDRHNNQKILIVGHKVVNRIILCHWLNLPIKEYRRKIPQRTCALNILTFESPYNAMIKSIDDLSYLV